MNKPQRCVSPSLYFFLNDNQSAVSKYHNNPHSINKFGAQRRHKSLCLHHMSCLAIAFRMILNKHNVRYQLPIDGKQKLPLSTKDTQPDPKVWRGSLHVARLAAGSPNQARQATLPARYFSIITPVMRANTPSSQGHAT